MSLQLTQSIASGEQPLADAVRRVGESTAFPGCAQATDRAACMQTVLQGMTRMTAKEFAQMLREQLGCRRSSSRSSPA